MNEVIYTFIINFKAEGVTGWDYAENTPELGIIGQVFTPKPLTYKEAEELIVYLKLLVQKRLIYLIHLNFQKKIIKIN